MIALLPLLLLSQLVSYSSCEPETAHEVRNPLLVRNKRALIDYMCPSAQASGDDKGENSFVIFYSPSKQDDVQLEYGPDGWNNDTIQTLIESGFNSSKPTILYSHGYHQTGQQAWLLAAREIYNEMMTNQTEALYNMLIFDWSYYSDYRYWTSVSYVPHLGRVLGEFLENLGNSSTLSYDMDKMHLIAYSLSTHIAGLAGRQVASNLGAPVGQITALDPTGVCMHSATQFAEANSLRQTDAKFVVARHYNMDELGAKRPIGGLDIFVNGGKKQPQEPVDDSYRRSRFVRDVNGGVSSDSDSDSDDDDEIDDSNMVVMARADHRRATAHETQALSDQCYDIAYECKSYEAYEAGECADCGPDGSKCYFISNYKELLAESEGEQLRSSNYAPGTKMYLKTSYQDPYCMHHYQLLAELQSNASSNIRQLVSSGRVELQFPDGQTFQLRGCPKGTTFTTLGSSTDKLQGLSSMRLKVNAAESDIQEFSNSLDHMEMNYMSHYSPDERAKASYRLCLNEDKNSLIRCNTTMAS